MQKREWIPSDYEDEVVPTPRATPGDWVTRLSDGAFALAGNDVDGPDPEPGCALKDGDVVEFSWTESYGRFDLTFHNSDEDGWTATLDGDEPDASPGGSMTVAEWGNWETMGPSLSEFVENYDDKEDGETISIQFYAWSERPVPYVFRGGVFAAVEPALAA